MSGRVLLDTHIVIALLEDEAAVRDKLEETDEVFLSSIALGELYFGAWKSGQPQANLSRIDEFAADNVVMGCDTGTARRYVAVRLSRTTRRRLNSAVRQPHAHRECPNALGRRYDRCTECHLPRPSRPLI